MNAANRTETLPLWISFLIPASLNTPTSDASETTLGAVLGRYGLAKEQIGVVEFDRIGPDHFRVRVRDVAKALVVIRVTMEEFPPIARDARELAKRYGVAGAIGLESGGELNDDETSPVFYLA